MKGGGVQFYAVAVGVKAGIYNTWDETNLNVKGYPNAKYKKFKTEQEAKKFISLYGNSGLCGPVKRKQSGVKDSRPMKKVSNSSFQQDVSIKLQGVREVYCDGSSLGNGKASAKAGIGIYWGDTDKLTSSNTAERLPGGFQTNNRAELYAVARILELDPTPDLPLCVCTDSTYTMNSSSFPPSYVVNKTHLLNLAFVNWLPVWEKKGWKTATNKTPENLDLIRYIAALFKLRDPSDLKTTTNVLFKKVKAHAGIYANEMADELAKRGAGMESREEMDFETLRKDVERRIEEKLSYETTMKTRVLDIPSGSDEGLRSIKPAASSRSKPTWAPELAQIEDSFFDWDDGEY